MTRFSRADIDALVDGMSIRADGCVLIGCDNVYVERVRAALYLAAGMTAEGKEKPVRCRLYPDYYGNGRPLISAMIGTSDDHRTITGGIPGTFVPDPPESR